MIEAENSGAFARLRQCSEQLFDRFGLALVFIALLTAFLVTSVPLNGVSGYGALYRTGYSFNEFNNLIAWAALAEKVADGDLFPISPVNSGLGASIPYLLIWAQGFLSAIFGINATITLLGASAGAMACVVLTAIYRLFLPRLWSVALMLLSAIYATGIPARDFLMSLAHGCPESCMPVSLPLNMSLTPFPSVGVLAFLIALYFTIRPGSLGNRRVLMLAVLWGLQAQINILNYAFGVPFFLLLIAAHHLRNGWSGVLQNQILSFIGAIALCIFLAAPQIYGGLMMVGEIARDASGYSSNVVSGGQSSHFYVTYFILPVILMILVYFSFKVDFAELLIRFQPIWMLLVTEIVLTNVLVFSDIGVTEGWIELRLGIYAVHLLVFVPPLYYMTREGLRTYHNGIESSALMTLVRRALTFAFGRFSWVYLLCGLVLAGLYVGLLSERVVASAKVNQPYVTGLEEEFAIVEKHTAPGDMTISASMNLNLFLPMVADRETLLLNRFVDPAVSIEEAVIRSAVLARVQRWSMDRFLTFMGRNDRFSLASADMIDLSDMAPAGLGYWLIYNNKVLNDIEKQRYRDQIRSAYSSVVPADYLKEAGFEIIFSLFPSTELTPQYQLVSEQPASGEIFVYALSDSAE